MSWEFRLIVVTFRDLFGLFCLCVMFGCCVCFAGLCDSCWFVVLCCFMYVMFGLFVCVVFCLVVLFSCCCFCSCIV